MWFVGRWNLLLSAVVMMALFAAAPGYAQDNQSSSLLDRYLDRALERSGVDPQSQEAESAKSFGKIWMNPLSTQEDIDRELDRIRREYGSPSYGSSSSNE